MNYEERNPRLTRIDAKEKSRKRKSFALLPVIRANLFLCFIYVNSWLRSKSKHFDRGRDFDVLVAHDEI